MWQDLRYSLRTLRHSPGFALTALFVLAFGIGINTAIFSVIHAVLFNPPPVQAAHEIRYVYLSDERFVGFPNNLYRYLKTSNDVFTDLVAVTPTNAKLGAGGNFRVVPGESVSANYFEVLGVRAVIGRTLSASVDEQPDAPRVVVISHAMWLRQFNADPAILGKTIRLTRSSVRLVDQWPDYTIVGVIAAEYKGIASPWQPTQFWVPLVQRAIDYLPPPSPVPPPSVETATVSLAIGRMRPDADDERVHAVISTLGAQFKDPLRPNAPKRDLVVRDARRVRLPFDSRRQIVPERLAVGLMSVAGLVLLIATANLAGLLMARGVTRRGEIAVRLSLGASKWRVARQLFSESFVVALVGGGLGILVARVLILVFLDQTPAQFGASSATYSLEVPINLAVLAFTAGLCLIAGLVVGLAPARQAAKVDLLTVLAGFSSSASRRSGRLRHWIVVPQVGLSVLVLLMAGAVTRPLLRAELVDPGYQPDGLVFVEFDLYIYPRTEEDERRQLQARRELFYRRLLDRAQGSSAFSRATLSLGLPFQPMSTWIVDREQFPNARHWYVSTTSISPEYFDTLGIRLLRGRAFDAGDRSGTPSVAIICERLAQWLWPGENPIGRYIGRHHPDSTVSPVWFEIVGVVNEVQPPLSAGAGNPYLYVPLDQSDHPYARAILARGPDSGGNLERTLRQVIFDSDGDAEILRSGTVEDAIGSMRYPRRMAAGILALSGVMGLILASMGIYGVVSYSVAQRLREIGIRAALGARRAQLIHLVILDGLKVVVVGSILGGLSAVVAFRLGSTLVYSFPALDAGVFVTLPLVLASVILAACYIPARRAGRVDPITVLRNL
jgi:putative ABC transport system permease protein